MSILTVSALAVLSLMMPQQDAERGYELAGVSMAESDSIPPRVGIVLRTYRLVAHSGFVR